MKNLIYLISIYTVLILFSLTSLTAQEGDVYVSIGGGASIPLADYAKTDFNDEASGFAKVGGNFNINFGYRFNEYFSLSGLLNGCVNRYDYIKAQDELYNVFKTDFPDTQWIVTSKSWGLGGMLIGATVSIPLGGNKISFEVRAMGGFIYAHSPTIYITGKETGVEDKILNIEQSSAASWAFDAGAGFRYNRTSKQYFILFADYMMAQPHFSNVAITSVNNDLQRQDTFTQDIGTLNISIGIGYIVN